MAQVTYIHLTEDNISDFAEARNEALFRAPTEWVMFVDNDEEVTPELRAEIEKAVISDRYDAYEVERIDTFLGRRLAYGETAHARFIRLGRRTAGTWVRPVHEVWKIEGTVGKLTHPLYHTPHATMGSFLSKINRYSTLEAEYRYSKGSISTLIYIVVFPVAKFLKNYIWLQGYRDGVPGIIMAIMMSFHSFLTWSKLYILWHKNLPRQTV